MLEQRYTNVTIMIIIIISLLIYKRRRVVALQCAGTRGLTVIATDIIVSRQQQ